MPREQYFQRFGLGSSKPPTFDQAMDRIFEAGKPPRKKAPPRGKKAPRKK